MSFASIAFLIFFCVTIAVMATTNAPFFGKLQKDKLLFIRHVILLIASYVFYGYWDARFLLLMIFITIACYFSALGIAKNENKPQKKFFVFLGIALPLIVLITFKYFNFFVDSFAAAFGIKHALSLNLILPLGISFYIFQSMGYVLDVYRGLFKAERNFIHVALYIAFFPQLVAGPIVKAHEFLPQLREDRNITLDNFAKGIQIFLFGLAKKVVLADHLSVFVDDVYRAPGAYSSFTIFLAIVSYAMQIYFDFSGYSDMAVGTAKCLGYDLPRNFNLPYLSKNITEFWKRWHISLSTWFMNYLYYSLAQNRKGNVRLKSYVNLIITMLLCGLWHGASFAFIVFGGLHGLLLCAHKLFNEIVRKRKKKLKKQGVEKERSKTVTIIISGISIFLTASFASMVFVFFRAGDIGDAFIIFGRLFTFQDGINQPFSWAFISLAVLICGYIIAAIKSKQNIGKQGKIEYEGYYPIFNLEKIWGLAIVIAAAGLIVAFAYTGNNPFVYFQF